jgi:outer membrane protein assembly factor BamB
MAMMTRAASPMVELATPTVTPASPTRGIATTTAPGAVDVPVIHRSGPGRTGVYEADPLRQQPAELWQRDLGPEQTTEPLCFEDWLLIASLSGTLSLLDASNGETRWEAQLGGPVIAPPVIVGDLVIVNSLDGGVFGLALADGSERWHVTTEGRVWYDPLPVGDLALVLTDDRLMALELDSGAERWSAALIQGDLFGRLAADETRAYAAVNDTLLALDLETGERQWTIEQGDGWLSPALADGALYAGNLDGSVYAVDAAGGDVLWQFRPDDAPLAETYWSGPAVVDGTVYIGNTNQVMFAIDAEDGSEQWRFATEDWATADPLVVGDLLYFGVGTHIGATVPRPLYAIERATGRELWQFPTSGLIEHAACASAGRLYVVTSAGVLSALVAPE